MKRKILRLSFSALFVLGLAQAQTQVVPQSGINWRESSLTVTRFQPSSPSHRESFRCFDQTFEKLPIKVSLYDLGYDNSDSGPLTLNQALKERECFQQAGWYEVSVLIFDYAGNSSLYEKILTIVPGELSLSDSTVSPVASKTSGGQSANLDIAKRSSCTSSSLIADGLDTCVLEVNLRDRFGNVIKPEGLSGELSLKLPSEGVAPNFDANRNPYGAFLAGLYFDDHQKNVNYTLPQADRKIQVGLRAYVPSIELDKENTGLSQAVKTIPQPVNIEMTYNPAAEDQSTITTNKTVTPLFAPWVEIMADTGESTPENFALLPLNRAIRMPLLLTGIIGKELPRKVSIDWNSPELESLDFKFEASNDDPSSLRNLVTINDNPEPYPLEVSLVQPEGVVRDTAFRLRPIITYLLKIKDENALVRYPVSLIQNRASDLLPALRPSLLKTSIETSEGKEITPDTARNLILSDTDKILYSDWRRRMSRNFIWLTRGVLPSSNTEFNVNTDFDGSGIAFVKGVDLKITGLGDLEAPIVYGGGEKTIIVEDGNVVINRDLVYKSKNDSLGIIIINSKPRDLARGNLFVRETVKKIVGSYFLDGALLSSTELEKPDMNEIIEDRETTPNQNLRAPLARQLLIEGLLVSRNTLGGADLSNPIGPNGQRVARKLGLIYDLNYVRRYEPPFDIDGVRVADKDNRYCYKPVGDRCYPNPAPLIIRYDDRIENIPPPAFEADEL